MNHPTKSHPHPETRTVLRHEHPASTRIASQHRPIRTWVVTEIDLADGTEISRVHWEPVAADPDA